MSFLCLGVPVRGDSVWGAHAPSRAGFDALVETLVRPCVTDKFAMTGASSPAREGACAPQISATLHLLSK